MSNASLHIQSVDDGQGIIGITFEEGTNVFLPLYYMDDKEQNISELTPSERLKLKNMVIAWKKFQARNKSINSSQSEQPDGYYDFNTSLNIIKDFVEYGLYSEFEHIDKIRKHGKIDFAKSIKRCRPLFTNQGAVYLSFVTRQKKYKDEDFIRNTQARVLNEISKQIGWMIGFNINFPAQGIPYKSNQSLLSNLLLVRGTSFNSRKLQLINLLISYIDMKGGRQGHLDEYFVGTAFRFWEDMVSDVLSNVTKKEMRSIYYVRHAYMKRTNSILVRTLDPLMPDAVLKNNKSLIILDAKYYTSGNKPNNDDVTKQFSYMAKAFNYYKDEYSYRNIFILPTDTGNYFLDEQIVFDADIACCDEYVPIELLYINLEELLFNYIHDKRDYSLLI